jgi:hypothetical protein
MRHLGPLFGLVFLVSVLLVGASATPVVATPVATEEATYGAFGRVFPDPQGCVRGLPGTSPWAKGNVCAEQFIQYDEAIAGLGFLEARFPRYLNLIDLKTDLGQELSQEEMQSAGLPQLDLSRLRSDLHVVKVTDAQSAVPEADRKHFAYSLSIHGIERAGLEGGIRAAEDLVTWAACETNASAAPACAAEGSFPKRILEPSNSGPTAGEVLRSSVIYFVLANPDGWRRGDLVDGGVFYQRYNGNGMDLNRDWPTIGYTERQYTPFSEPETRGFGAYLKAVKEQTSAKAFTGGIDLHGMLTARSFSFTLLGAGERDYRRNAITVDTAIRTFRDAEERLTWSKLILPADQCPGPIHFEDPVLTGADGDLPMCADQWGTVWDTIDYQITGGFGDWMESPLGLDGIGIDNEMAISHLTFNNVFNPEIEQLHVDGNKGLIYAQIASLLQEQPVRYVPDGEVGYIFDPRRITNAGGAPVDPNPNRLPAQQRIEHLNPSGILEFRFDVKGPADGVFNGGLTVEATYGNVDGISPSAAAVLILDYCGPSQHPGDPNNVCREIARYFNQSAAYLQAGARIDLNAPPPGPYRIRSNAARALPTKFVVSFSSGQAYPQPTQLAYDVSRMDFFTDLNKYVPAGSKLAAIPVSDVLTGKGNKLSKFDTVVVAGGNLLPGFVPTGEFVVGEAQPNQTFAFGATSAAIPQSSDAAVEFQVLPGFDNDRMVVRSTWAVPSDYDMFVEWFNPSTAAWETRGCQCAFVNNGETVTLFDPDVGKWRVRLANFLAAPQPVSGTITFTALAAPEAAPSSQFTTAEFKKYAAALARFADRGGNLVLTDSAFIGLPTLGSGVPAEAVASGYFFAGWMDFDDGAGATYDRHHLAAGVNKEGTAEGMDTVDGRNFVHRHQTYEPVPLGYYVSPSGASNSACTADRCDSPNWIVRESDWLASGGTVAAETLVRMQKGPGPSKVGVSLGELPFGKGQIRVAGALFPDPTEENLHPYGLFSYALTYTGYQVFENLLDQP